MKRERVYLFVGSLLLLPDCASNKNVEKGGV